MITARTPLTKQHKEKLRQKMLGKPRTEEQKRKLSETRKRLFAEGKLKKWNLGKKGYTTSWKGRKMKEETKNKIRIANTGKIRTEEAKEKMSKAKLGTHPTEETRIKLKLSAKKGEESHLWKGGITQDDAFYCRIRRNRKLNAFGLHTKGEWETLKAQYNWTCPCCKRSEPEIKLTEDHIIPLSRGGSDNIENIQPLCRSCNCKKHTKTIKYEI